MPNGASIWTHSTTLAKPIEMFTKGVELRAQLRQIEMENQARTFNQTMEAIKQNDRRKEAEVDADQRQQQIDQQIRESENRMTLARENLDLRRRAMEMRASGGTSSAPTPVDSAGEPAPSVTVPDAAATPLPGEPSAANFMAAAPAGDSISPLDMSGDGQGGMPMQAIPSVDSVLEQNPTRLDEGAKSGSLIGGTVDKPIQIGGLRYAVINGVQNSQTYNPRTRYESKWTPVSSLATSPAGPTADDPTSGIYMNAEGIPVKKVGDAEMPVEAVTQRSSAGSVTMRQPKRIDASKVQLNDDGSGTFTDDSGQSIPVRAKGVSFRDGKYSVQYEVPGAEPVQTTLNDRMKAQVEALEKLGLPVKSASFNSRGDIQLRGSAPAETKPEADTIGAITKGWASKSKEWRDELIDTVIAPSPEHKASVILNKPKDEIQPGDMQKMSAEQWSRGYTLAREGAAALLANHIEKVDGVPAAKVKAMLLGAAPDDSARAAISEPEALPPPDPRLGLAPQAVAPEPPTTAPQKSKAKSFLDRITGKK